MLFKVTDKNNKGNSLFIQGSYSRSTSNDVASITFQNYDDDTKSTYNIARIAARDAFGNADLNGYGDLLFLTSGAEGALLEKMRIKSSGSVCINTSNAITSNSILSVNGNATFSSNVTSQDLIVSSNATVSNDLYVIGDTTVNGSVTATSNLSIYNDLDIFGTTRARNSMIINGGLVIKLNSQSTSNNQQTSNINTEVTLSNDLRVLEDGVIQGTLDVNSNVTFCNNLTVLGSVSFRSNLTIQGHTIFTSFDVSNDIIVNGNTTIQSALVVNSNAIIGKDSILVGNVTTMSNVTLGASPSSNLLTLNGRATLTASTPSSPSAISALTINQLGQGPIFTVQKSAATKLTITNDGYLGINTSNPSKPLEVNGDVNFIGDIYQNSTLLQKSPTTLSFEPIKTTAKTYKSIVSWINNSKKLDSLYVTSYTSSPSTYSLRVYDSTNNKTLHTSSHSNQAPSNLNLALTNVTSNALINMELHCKAGSTYTCVQNVLLNYQ